MEAQLRAIPALDLRRYARGVGVQPHFYIGGKVKYLRTETLIQRIVEKPGAAEAVVKLHEAAQRAGTPEKAPEAAQAPQAPQIEPQAAQHVAGAEKAQHQEESMPQAAELFPPQVQAKPETPAAVSPAQAQDAAGKLQAAFAEILRTATHQTLDRAQVEAIIRDTVTPMLAELKAPVRVTLAPQPPRPEVDLGLQHRAFPNLLRKLSARRWVFISGPAGSGKTQACHNAAQALGLKFHFNGAIGNKYELLGFVDAQGRAVETPFKRAYRDGGVYLLDEVDGSDPNALLALNPALANGSCDFPGEPEPIQRHKDFICVASGNTWGLGGTSDYVGRGRLDQSTLNRFVKLAWDYDEALEVAISGNPTWTGRVQALRAKARERGLKILITPRASIDGAALLNAGETEQEALESTILFGLSADQREALIGKGV